MDALIKIAACLLADAFRIAALLFRSAKSLQAGNLFLRRQLALLMERGARPRRIGVTNQWSPPWKQSSTLHRSP